MGEVMLVILGFLLFTGICCAIDPDIAEDAQLTTPQLIAKYGYNVEVHYVTTTDDYILELHRIIGRQRSPPREGKKVCLLQHGFFDSSATWVLSGPHHGLGYLLADDNYDVWLGNNRGNRYACNHTFYDPFGTSSEREKFWSFSWHEMGILDLPAMIDYILDKTGQEKLQYIGHSQGTTAFFVMASELPKYNDKIEMMHALAPIAFLSNTASPPIRALAPFVTVLSKIVSLIGMYNVEPNNDFIRRVGGVLCRDQAPTQIICSNLLFLTTGYGSDQLNETLLPVIGGHTPAGASTDQMVHYGQLVNSGGFNKFSYGLLRNPRVYRSLFPPAYNLRNIRAPVAIYHSRNDWLAAVKDTEKLVSILPNVVHQYLVPNRKFNHVDFTWGIDAPTLLFNEIISKIKGQ